MSLCYVEKAFKTYWNIFEWYKNFPIVFIAEV